MFKRKRPKTDYWRNSVEQLLDVVLFQSALSHAIFMHERGFEFKDLTERAVWGEQNVGRLGQDTALVAFNSTARRLYQQMAEEDAG